MAAALDTVWKTRVAATEPQGDGWIVRGEGIVPFPFDGVIITVPAQQAAALLAPVDRRLADLAAAAISAPCCTAMAAIDSPVSATGDVLGEPRESIGWAPRNSAKPGRAGPKAWVV